MNKFCKLIFVLMLIPVLSHALEVDEKLTLRIIKASESRKTILINRGFEDGLIKGDHAKFFLSLGVVARAVMIKGSPARSVWSVYRLVNADYIGNDQVMNLKITAPVKVTKDESRSLIQDDLPSAISTNPRDLGIPLADGAQDMSPLEKAQKITTSQLSYSQDITKRNTEIFTSFHFAQYGASITSNQVGAETVSATESVTSLSLGYEYYFDKNSKLLSRVSAFGQFGFSNMSTSAHDATTARNESLEYGGGVNIYPFSSPNFSNKLIPFGNFTFMLGNTTSTSEPLNATSESLAGVSNTISVGGGVKYFAPNGYGGRIQFDFISRTDTYAVDSSGATRQKTKTGPRLAMGFSYRY